MFELVTDPVQQLAAAVEQLGQAAETINALLAGGALRECADRAVMEFTKELAQIQERVSAAESVMVAGVDASGVARGDGYLSTQAWLRGALGWERQRATRSLRTARLLSHTYVDTKAAWLRGDIAQAHADAISHGLDKAVRTIDPAERDEARRNGEKVLLTISRQFSPDHTQAAVRRIRAAADPDGLRAAAVEADGKQWVRLTHVGDGWVLRGWLDDVNGAALASVLEGRRNSHFHTGFDGLEAHEDLTNSADASTQTAEQAEHEMATRIYHHNALILGELAQELLNGGNAGAIGGERPHLELSITLAELAAGVGYGELNIPATNTSVPASIDTIRQMSCDAQVRRVVTSGDHFEPDTGEPVDPVIGRLMQSPSEVVDYGRSERIVPPGLRRRLVRRDNGCVFPTCTRPAAYTHAHHVKHWSEDGPTDLNNLALVCNRHHTAIHCEGWQLIPRAGRAANQPGYWQVLPPQPLTQRPSSESNR